MEAFATQDTLTNSPHIFVSTKCNQIQSFNFWLNLKNIQRKQNGHNLYKQPPEAVTGCDSKLLWSEPVKNKIVIILIKTIKPADY